MSYHYFEIYPEHERNTDHPLYFIEFLQFFDKDPITWKLYKRQLHRSQSELEKLKVEDPKSYAIAFMCNEFHPWWLLDGELQPEGTVPDKKWLLWMVDALNEKVKKDLTSTSYSV